MTAMSKKEKANDIISIEYKYVHFNNYSTFWQWTGFVSGTCCFNNADIKDGKDEVSSPTL